MLLRLDKKTKKYIKKVEKEVAKSLNVLGTTTFCLEVHDDAIEICFETEIDNCFALLTSLDKHLSLKQMLKAFLGKGKLKNSIEWNLIENLSLSV